MSGPPIPERFISESQTSAFRQVTLPPDRPDKTDADRQAERAAAIFWDEDIVALVGRQTFDFCKDAGLFGSYREEREKKKWNPFARSSRVHVQYGRLRHEVERAFEKIREMYATLPRR